MLVPLYFGFNLGRRPALGLLATTWELVCVFTRLRSVLIPSPVGAGRKGMAVWEEFVRTFFIDFGTILHFPYPLGSSSRAARQPSTLVQRRTVLEMRSVPRHCWSCMSCTVLM